MCAQGKRRSFQANRTGPILPALQLPTLSIYILPYYFSTTSSARISLKEHEATTQKWQTQESSCVCVCPNLIALSVSVQPSSLGSTMYQAARKMFFTECRCAEDASKTYEDLFAQLDANKDGKVDVSELKAGLAAMGIKTGKGAAQVT